MQKLIAILATVIIFSSAKAADSSYIQKAAVTAAAEHKYILLNFSGSDWCIPCIKMKKTIFETDTFKQYAAEKLVWINADFPRAKSKLSKAQVKENEQLAGKYNQKGSFPYTLLLDAKGQIIKTWDGFPNETPQQFIKEVDTAINDHDSSTAQHIAPASTETNGQPL